MKTTMKYLAVYIGLTIATLLFTNETSAQRVSVSFQMFYDQLSPHGQWISSPQYGYVWLPNVSPGFSPYATNGYWVMTDYGMTWVSNYSWGWAPFHYGRWEFNNDFGWFWVPDTEWGPAWVVWRQSEGYYGWTPMQPGISINISVGRHYHPHHNHWVFVRYNDIDRHDLHRCYVGRKHHHHIINNSTVINNIYVDNSHHTTYVSGPNRRDFQRRTGRNIRMVSVHDNNRPGQNIRNGRMNIYRPRVTRTNGRNERYAPKRTANINDVRRNSNRNHVYRENTDRQQNNRNQTQRTNQSNNKTSNQQRYSNRNDRTHENNTNYSNNRKQTQKNYRTNNQTRNQQRYNNQTNRNQQYKRGNNKTKSNNRNSRTFSTSNSNKNTIRRQSSKQSNGRGR